MNSTTWPAQGNSSIIPILESIGMVFFVVIAVLWLAIIPVVGVFGAIAWHPVIHAWLVNHMFAPSFLGWLGILTFLGWFAWFMVAVIVIIDTRAKRWSVDYIMLAIAALLAMGAIGSVATAITG